MGFFDLLSSDFKRAIPELASQNGWRLSDISQERAVLEFETAGGNMQTLYVLKFPSTLEFSVPSAAVYDTFDQIPDHLATGLLKRNSELPIGFWTLEEIQGRWVFSVMHNEEISRLHAENFGKIVDALVSECDEFER